MYGSDAGQPVPSLYTKGLSPLCDTSKKKKANVVIVVLNLAFYRKTAAATLAAAGSFCH